MAFSEKNARVDVGVPVACLRAWRGLGTRAWSALVSGEWGVDHADVRIIHPCDASGKRARGEEALRVEETRTVDRRARRGATAVN